MPLSATRNYVLAAASSSVWISPPLAVEPNRPTSSRPLREKQISETRRPPVDTHGSSLMRRKPVYPPPRLRSASLHPNGVVATKPTLSSRFLQKSPALHEPVADRIGLPSYPASYTVEMVETFPRRGRDEHALPPRNRAGWPMMTSARRPTGSPLRCATRATFDRSPRSRRLRDLGTVAGHPLDFADTTPPARHSPRRRLPRPRSRQEIF